MQVTIHDIQTAYRLSLQVSQRILFVNFWTVVLLVSSKQNPLYQAHYHLQLLYVVSNLDACSWLESTLLDNAFTLCHSIRIYQIQSSTR